MGRARQKHCYAEDFLIDTTRCTACRGCQIGLCEWHDLPANETKQRGTHQNPPDLNPNNLKIVRFRERMKPDGTVVWNFFPDQCRHCITPICKEVADMAVPGAIIKDPKTGMVITTDKATTEAPRMRRPLLTPAPTTSPALTPRPNA